MGRSADLLTIWEIHWPSVGGGWEETLGGAEAPFTVDPRAELLEILLPLVSMDRGRVLCVLIAGCEATTWLHAIWRLILGTGAEESCELWGVVYLLT